MTDKAQPNIRSVYVELRKWRAWKAQAKKRRISLSALVRQAMDAFLKGDARSW